MKLKTINKKGLKVTLNLLAALQLMGGAALWIVLADESKVAIPTPLRLALVLLLQAIVTAAVATAGQWKLQRQVYAAVIFAAICCISFYFLYQPYVSGKNVDVEGIRYRVEGVIVIVILCGFAVLNLLFASGLRNRSQT